MYFDQWPEGIQRTSYNAHVDSVEFCIRPQTSVWRSRSAPTRTFKDTSFCILFIMVVLRGKADRGTAKN